MCIVLQKERGIPTGILSENQPLDPANEEKVNYIGYQVQRLLAAE
jgi:hypothetical protein